jgi:hypothetical protein
MAKAAPVKRFKLGYVEASVWKNDTYYSVTLDRSYKDAEGKWQTTDSLGTGDLLNTIKVLERCEQWIAEQV